jgi:hypothetical protein
MFVIVTQNSYTQQTVAELEGCATRREKPLRSIKSVKFLLVFPREIIDMGWPRCRYPVGKLKRLYQVFTVRIIFSNVNVVLEIIDLHFLICK